MTGKEKCRSLRAIRERIAEKNGIDMVFQECNHSGECSGTCPYCEGEVRQLEDQLKKKAGLGKKIVLAGLCAGMIAAVAGCSVFNEPVVTTGIMPAPTATAPVEVLMGDIEQLPAGLDALPGEVAQ